MITDLATPIVTNNGTSREALKAQQMEILRAAHVLEGALADAYPNGRDYIGDGARFSAAMTQHDARIAAVGDIIRDATNIVIALRKS